VGLAVTEHTTKSVHRPLCTITGKRYKLKPPDSKYVWIFSEHLEIMLDRFDKPIIEFCQRSTFKLLTIFCNVVTALVAIEYMIAMPIFFYILGQDELATKILYLSMVLVILSQIPKRFVWRYRPFMGYRAIEVQATRTSSFPSRAVACSVIYCYIIDWIFKDSKHYPNPYFEWWMFLVLFLLPVLISFARINLGVHYPSDCIAGVVLGLTSCLLGRVLFFADSRGCSCNESYSTVCYPNNSTIQSITLQHIDLNWTLLACTIVGQIIFALLCILKPIQFWVKFGAVFGLLFPALTFRLIFLCPVGPNYLLSLPPTKSRDTFNLIACAYGFGVVVLGMIVGIKLQKKLLFWVFVVYWIFYMFVILLWRLYLQNLIKPWPV